MKTEHLKAMEGTRPSSVVPDAFESSQDVEMKTGEDNHVLGGGGGGDQVQDQQSVKNGKRDKKGWAELKEDVRSLRRKLWTLGFRLPHGFTFRKMEDKTRIYFMATPHNSRENSIFAVDVQDLENVQMKGRLPWIQILASGFQGGLPHTIAELLMMERKRTTPTGIGEYHFHEESSKFLISASSSLYHFVDNGLPHEYPVCPTEIKTKETSGARMNAVICPHDPNLIAFVNDGDVWVVNSLSGDEQRLTPSKNYEDEVVSAGFPSYIIQEEFNRYEGFWWQPMSDYDDVAKKKVYRIMYEEVDETDVPVVTLPSLPGHEPEKYRFPTPGKPNAFSHLRFVEFQVSDDNKICSIEYFDFAYAISQIFPWAEYIVRAGWVGPEGNFVWVMLLDRQQQRLELVLLPFHPANLRNSTGDLLNNYNKRNGLPNAPAYVVYSEKTDSWINVNDILHFFPSTAETITFLCTTEETGYRHLYLVTSKLEAALGPPAAWTSSAIPSMRLSPWVFQKAALTTGDWEVMNGSVAVRHHSTSTKFVFFIGLKDSPIERHLYVVSTTVPFDVRRLSNLGHSHTASFNDDCTLVVLTYSSVKDPPVCVVFRVRYTDDTVHGITLEPISQLTEPTPSIFSAVDGTIRLPDILCYQNQYGDHLYAMVYKPFHFDPSKKYPTILNVYGGPEVQLVYNSFRGVGQLWLYLLASQGYCVISIDSRGSYHRGVQFEKHIRRRMGTVELNDQVEVLEWLAGELKFIDMDRVGIYGWSYGGYLSLMGLVQYPKLFKVCIAGAPVTSWELYDSGYTERYMDLPENNPAGYKEGSVLTHAHKFPDETGRLLIVHGLNDENVHFGHTAELLNALIKWGKPYQLQIYPSERHSLRRLEASEHYETTLLSFLEQNL